MGRFKSYQKALCSAFAAAVVVAFSEPVSADDRGWNRRSLRNEIEQDRRDLRDSRQQLEADRQELKQDRREYRQDRRAGASKEELAREKAEIRDSREELQDSRREVQRDRRELQRDLGEYDWRYDRDRGRFGERERDGWSRWPSWW